jgi:hypothetical protein
MACIRSRAFRHLHIRAKSDAMHRGFETVSGHPQPRDDHCDRQRDGGYQEQGRANPQILAVKRQGRLNGAASFRWYQKHLLLSAADHVTVSADAMVCQAAFRV